MLIVLVVVDGTLQDSVTAKAGGPSPPKPKADVTVPELAGPTTAVFLSFCSDQTDPVHNSVLAVPGPVPG